MTIWLVKIGEPVPVGPNVRDRVHRTGNLGRFLAARGHRVVWWTSTFDHYRKKHICDESDKTVSLGDRFTVRLLRGCGYSRNIGFARMLDHALLARRYSHVIVNEPKPDLILAALPTVDLCLASIEYGDRMGVPVVLDMRDMWPDIFVEAAPALLKAPARILLHPLFRKAHGACARATAITGITEAFVEWGLNRGGRTRSQWDRAFPFVYPTAQPRPEAIEEACAFWDARGLGEHSDRLVVCFSGSLGSQYDLTHIIDAVKLLNESGQAVQFIVCGVGERLEEFTRYAAAVPQVLFAGWVDAAKIYVLMRRSHLGLNPLPERFDFLATINNKAVEYLSAGLPMVSSPRRGVLRDLLQKEECGVSYGARDAQSLATILREIAGDRERLRRMSANAIRVFTEQFTAEKVCAEMASYLEHIASTSRATCEFESARSA